MWKLTKDALHEAFSGVETIGDVLWIPFVIVVLILCSPVIILDSICSIPLHRK